MYVCNYYLVFLISKQTKPQALKIFFVLLSFVGIAAFIACNPTAKEIAAKVADDSIRKADSLAQVEAIKQRIDDSINKAKEQKGIDNPRNSKKSKENKRILTIERHIGGVEDAWRNISYQLSIYQSFENLPSSEKLEAFNIILSGYEQLEKDIEYFLAYSNYSDYRRPMAEKFYEVMKTSRNK